tara:strand:- start:3510 stop:3677 length:168 start_codon:yes stop_codon:yes gene_type:complete
MGLFNVLRGALKIVSKASDVAEKVTPVIGVAEVLVDTVGDAVKPKQPKQSKKKGK